MDNNILDFSNSLTRVFVDGVYIPAVVDLSVSWNSCGWAQVKIESVLPLCISSFELFRVGSTVSVVLGHIVLNSDTARKGGGFQIENGMELFSVEGINAIEKYMDRVTCSDPRGKARLTMGISFSGTMRWVLDEETLALVNL